ncbi:MAG TPA: nitroreductase family protein [Acidimicrobiales bacterium]
MHLNLSADEVLTTTRAVRKRLDLDRPVERELVEECIAIAIQAPTASNGQGYHWVVVTDPEIKKPIAEHYRNSFEMFYGNGGGPSPYPEDDPRTDRLDAVVDSAAYLARRLHEVPVWVIPCFEGRMGEGLPSFLQASLWGSIMPAAWSFMLAARERGLGTAWTTLHLPQEKEAAELLGLPYDQITQVGLIPVAHTKGTDFKSASRVSAADRTHWDRW